ncbi:ParA family protein [Sphingobacterium kitahiroshimense]|uniref:AAA family ATPase n=1 Tax=Sphingobacterium kitahiroshimense TaxID=470446 RepID=A0ABV0C1D5_9SPHI
MKVICLINMKGGVGKTTLSVNLCDCLARRNKAKVLLIDIDPQFNSTQCLMSTDEYINHLKNKRDTIINVYDRNVRPIISTVDGINDTEPKKIDEIEPILIKENFYLLPGNLELYRIEMSPGEGRENKLNKYIKSINEKYDFDYVIIDTPPTPSIWMTSALLASDYYLIPVKPDPISFTGLDLLQSIINERKENLDLKIECCGVVLTIVEPNTLVYSEAVNFLEGGRWKKYKFAKELHKRTKIARTQMSKTFILDLDDPQSKLNLVGIMNEMLKRINNE